ncbi:MAG: FAD:protein FMN transferase [Actinomycetia bacterium]|nr:FAD:protein FMN transferase [Actinomycetes bacterium]
MTDRSNPETFCFEHHAMLGTMIDVRVGADDEVTADAADERVAAEIIRLESVFSAYDEGSELCRWRRGEVKVPSPEFVELMGRALEWHVGSNGGFNPLVGELSGLWQRAETMGSPPSEAQLARVVAAIRAPRYEMGDGAPVSVGDCSALNLNAIAKGYIVDRALDSGLADGITWVSVNAGGDLAIRGSGAVRAGIENPHRPYDNEPPLTLIELAEAALATSGDARRGFRVGGRWFGHVLDPRTGWPVERIASISVVAGDAMTADVLATVAGVMTAAEGVEFLDGIEGAEGLVVDRDGEQWVTRGWSRLVVN